ncbi:Serine/threonine-protein phosphatase with EF-hands 2 [Pteropus alecto]|uniref:Serine/threonine-protein phosphatase with EF-hands n=1 Tax=Pteropus alecto TaxID=9402 RepID=L5KZM5_PTEAL|nr:Serine/threonine-protein phosphatase with EF-hands 2 [Pteropus alecto]
MGSGTSTQHHFAFQNAEKAFKAAALIQKWYRRYMARLEMRRQCTWSIFQSIEYAGQQDQVKLHDFFSYLVDHFTPSSHNERKYELPQGDFLNRMFTEGVRRGSEMEKFSDYESIEVPDNYTGPRLSFPLLPDHATALVEAFRLKQQLHARYVLNLLHETRKHLVQLPNINRLSTCYSEEITVCGKSWLEMALQARLKQENSAVMGEEERYGFTKEVMHKYKTHGKKILKILQDVFCWLPLATLVDEKVLILHGGVSDMTDLELLSKLDRHKIVSTLRCKTRKENGKQAEEKGKANQTSSEGRPSPWFLPQSRSLPSSPLRLSSHKAQKAGRSSSVPCGSLLEPRELSRKVRRSVDLELERCRQKAGFTVIKEKEEPWTLAPEADSAEAEELLEPTLEEWRQVVDILWSDPMAQEGCKANTVRGGGCYFGPNVTEQLLQKYNLQFLIRSHECKPEGYEFCHSRKVLTIFSASNYYEVGSNRGAYVKLGPALTPHIVQYQANKATHMLTMRQRQDLISRVEESALRALREKLFAHSSDLLDEFKKHDKEKTGLITFSDWAAAVESTLHLGLPWRMLRPQLVNRSTDNMLEYKSWLADLAKEQLSHEIDITDDCICDLARSIDFNKDGHIDINEFLEAFRLVEQSCSEGNAADCPQTTSTDDSGSSKPGAH